MNLKESYKELLARFNNEPFLGVIIDDSPHLWALVLLSSRLKTIDQVCDMILGTLASNWTFNAEDPELPEFPEGYGQEETQRWEMAIGKAPYLLSHLLANRVGNCATYAITLGICLKVNKKAESVEIGWAPPHAWVKTYLPTHRILDLSQRSHGYTATELPVGWKSLEL